MGVTLMDQKAKHSLPRTDKLHGLTIRKFPCGDYWEFIGDMVDALPEIFSGIKTFEGKSSSEVLGTLFALDKAVLFGLLAGSYEQLFEKAVFLFAKWFDVTEDEIRGMYPDDLVECLKRLWEVNKPGEALTQVLSRLLSGFKNLSPSAPDSESQSPS